MKRIFQVVMASCLLWAGQALAVQGNVNFLLGQKTLDSNDWAPYDEQGELGVLFDIRDDYWPVSLAVDLLGSAKTRDYWWGDATASSGELDLGVRKVFDITGASLHPYVGGGLALINARYEENDYTFGTWSTSDSGSGVWLNGGIYYSFGEHFNLGLDVRFSRADVTLLDYFGNPVNVSAGGNHAGLVMGYRW